MLHADIAKEENLNRMEESQGGENVKVVVRVRPLNSKELDSKYKMITKVNTIDGTIKVEQPKKDITMDTPAKCFTFDTVFAPEVKQVDVYNRVARPIVNNVLEGYNGVGNVQQSRNVGFFESKRGPFLLQYKAFVMSTIGNLYIFT